MHIPPELISLARERRLIPFLGAGFSASLNLPSWDKMLRTLSEHTEGSLPFDDLMRATDGDLLQVAEYLYLKCDKRIGPLRHVLERALTQHSSTLLSGAHVELVNLGAAQIYTTNYDDLLESTYREIGLPVSSVVLPKDVALAHTDRTQIVKYHGDLSHESTLVLTESAYYKRLDFESPMDLKFRSDLLGKSVLFMGYSFRDVNIRIIWFKLMEMMRDIPESDRRPSYIVRLDPNPALDELNAAVGLRTIVLNDQREASDGNLDRESLLSKFLYQLATAASLPQWREQTNRIFSEAGLPFPGGPAREDEESTETIPGTDKPLYMSTAALESATASFENMLGILPKGFPISRYRDLFHGSEALEQLMKRTVLPPLREKWENVMELFLPLLPVETEEQFNRVMLRLEESDRLMAAFVLTTLMQVGADPIRERKKRMIGLVSDWSRIWSASLSPGVVAQFLELLREEVSYQEGGSTDEDLAYLLDIGARILTSGLGKRMTLDQRSSLQELMGRAEKLYPGVSSRPLDSKQPLNIEDLIALFDQRPKRNTSARTPLLDELLAHRKDEPHSLAEEDPTEPAGSDAAEANNDLKASAPAAERGQPAPGERSEPA